MITIKAVLRWAALVRQQSRTAAAGVKSVEAGASAAIWAAEAAEAAACIGTRDQQLQMLHTDVVWWHRWAKLLPITSEVDKICLRLLLLLLLLQPTQYWWCGLSSSSSCPSSSHCCCPCFGNNAMVSKELSAPSLEHEIRKRDRSSFRSSNKINTAFWWWWWLFRTLVSYAAAAAAPAASPAAALHLLHVAAASTTSPLVAAIVNAAILQSAS